MFFGIKKIILLSMLFVAGSAFASNGEYTTRKVLRKSAPSLTVINNFGGASRTSTNQKYGPAPIVAGGGEYAYVAPQNIAPKNVAEKSNSEWYVGIKFVENFLTANFEYSVDGGQYPEKDKLSFASQPGGSIVVGNKFSNNWRAELELGYTGVYSETESSDLGYGNVNIKFETSTTYATANIIYDFAMNEWGGFYLGAGMGAAMVNTKIIAPTVFFHGSDESETKTSLLIAGMAGYQKNLSEHLLLDLGARVWTYTGTQQTRSWLTGLPDVNHTFESDMGQTFNISLMLGLRYMF